MDAAPAQEIVVVAPRLPELPGEPAYSAFAIDESALEDAIRLDDALRQAPGVMLFRRSDSAVANPTIQGLSVRAIGPSGAGRALVTLDGVPQNDPFGGWVIWGALPPELIARATILRGSGAGPYGAGALTGVVALEERGEPGVAFTAEGGDHGHARVAGLGEVRAGALDFMLSAAAEHRDGAIPVREGRGAADEAAWLDAMTGAARVQVRQGDVVMSARASAYAEDRGGGVAGVESMGQGASASFTLVSAPRAGQMGWRLQAWALASDLASTFVAVAADRSSTTPASNQYETPSLGWGFNAAARWGDADSGFELGADMRATDGETHELFRFMGGAYTRNRVAGGETLVAGAYVETWRTMGAWLIAGGARVDSWSASNGVRLERDLANGAPTLDVRPEDSDAVTPTGRIGVRRELGDDAFLRAAAYAGFRPPTLNELHRPFRVGNDVTEANPALEPERLYGIDAGVGAETPAFSWSVGAFAAELVDPITNVTLGAGPGTFPPGVFVPAGGAYRQRLNAGEIDAYGVEAEASGALGAALFWRAALDYTHARVDGGAAAAQLTGFRPAQSPEWTITAGFSWRATTKLSLDADVLYESDRFEDDLNSRELPAVASIDLALAYRVREDALLFAALDNANDADIAIGETADGVRSYAAPRTLRIGLRFSR